MEPLDAIGIKFGTDKCSGYHNYLLRMEPYLRSLIGNFRMLEIGVWKGASIRMWLEYFPSAEIHGIDFYSLHGVEDPRFVFHHCNANSPDLWRDLGKFHLIIDDGSHYGPDVKSCLELGLDHVDRGGLWIIEDTCKTDYDLMDMIRPIFLELQDHNRDWCANPEKDNGRIAFIHMLKGLCVIGMK